MALDRETLQGLWRQHRIVYGTPSSDESVTERAFQAALTLRLLEEVHELRTLMERAAQHEKLRPGVFGA